MASSISLYNAIMSLSPDVYWTLDEASGPSIQKGTSTAANLTLSGSYTQASAELIPGDSTKFLTLTGGRGTAARGSIVMPATTMSVSFIARVRNVTRDNAVFFSIGSAGETTASNYSMIYKYLAYPTVMIVWEYGSSGTNVEITSDVRLNNGVYNPQEFQPVHITLVKDSSNKSFTTYVNGYKREVLYYTTEVTGSTSSVFYLGGTTATIPAETIDMDVGHFCYFQRVLSSEEILSISKASGFMPEDYTLGNAEYQVLEENQEQFGTYSSIVSNLEYKSNKLLSIAIDPLINPELLQGSEAYTTE